MGFGASKKFHHKYLFTVEVDGFGSAAFTTCSALEVEVEEVTVHEGGSLLAAKKEPGKAKYTDVTLTRGVSGDSDFAIWMNTVVEGASGKGLPEPSFRRAVSIIQTDRAGATLRRWDLVNAWPKKWKAGEWDAGSSEAVMEELVICFDYFLLGQ